MCIPEAEMYTSKIFHSIITLLSTVVHLHVGPREGVEVSPVHVPPPSMVGRKLVGR